MDDMMKNGFHAVGVDIYNHKITGDVSATVTCSTGCSTASGGKVLVLNDMGGKFMNVSEEKACTLRAQEHGHQPICCSTKESDDCEEVKQTNRKYILRKITPLECCRLQGFPDWWCAGLETESPSEDEVAYWQKIFEIYRNAVGKSAKPKSKNQIIKWLKSPRTDSAEYQMWGNGIALPCAADVMERLAGELENEELWF